MRSAPRIARYIALEVLQYTVLAFLAASPVILIPNVFDQLGDFLVVGVTGGDIRVVLGWVLVLVAGYSLPIAFVFGLLLALGRLYGDREIAAMRACGLGVFALMTPVVAVGALLSLFTGVVLIGFEHDAWKQIESTERKILSRGAVIEPGRFQRFGKRMILARDRRDKNHFEGIMISDHTAEEKPLLIFAESADYSFEPETGILRLLLANGDIRLDPYPNEEFVNTASRSRGSTTPFARPGSWAIAGSSARPSSAWASYGRRSRANARARGSPTSGTDVAATTNP